MIPRLLQICNVGRIVGGTAACAWTVTRSLPAYRHTVVFLNRIADDTRAAFAHCELLERQRVTRQCVAAIQPDVVLLHNTSPARCDARLPAPTIVYRHSTAAPVTGDVTLYCSRWLADRCGKDRSQVCYQAVPRPVPPHDLTDTRALREEPTVGRICTPVTQKWPEEIVAFYRGLASRFSGIRWEFVGCPAALQSPLSVACGQRAAFFEPAWQARSRLWRWDALLYHNPAVTESFGRTVAEAMRAGCIPIVDNRGGFREQIAPATGYLCDNEQQFAAAIAELHSPAHRWKMSQAARANADENFSLARFADNLRRRFGQAEAAFRARGGIR